MEEGGLVRVDPVVNDISLFPSLDQPRAQLPTPTPFCLIEIAAPVRLGSHLNIS